MIKLIVIDLDGTLLNSEKNIPNENKVWIKKAIEKNLFISISSGRSYVSGHKFIDELNLHNVPISFQNGSLIFKKVNNSRKIIHKFGIPSIYAFRIEEIINKKFVDMKLIVFNNYFDQPDMFINQANNTPYYRYFENNSYRIKYVDKPTDYIKNSIIPEIALEGLESDIRELLKCLGLPNKDIKVVKNDDIDDHAFYELVSQEASKEIAIHHILKYFNLNIDEVAFIGDNYNDMEVLKSLKYSFSMANAPEEVKKICRYVSKKTNDEAGVAEIIENIIIGDY
ncbi:MAG: hypothetical protein PWQ77_508 [Kosmotogales bacterium]|nr:hypothetical protein [Kosmotogales bacterium]